MPSKDGDRKDVAPSDDLRTSFGHDPRAWPGINSLIELHRRIASTVRFSAGVVDRRSHHPDSRRLLGGRLAFSTRLLSGVASMALSFVALIPFGMSSGAAGLSLIAYELLGSFGGVLAMVSFVMNVPRWVKRHEIARTMAAATLVPELGAMIGAPIGGVLGDTFGFLPLLVTSVGLAVAIALWSAVKTVADQSRNCQDLWIGVSRDLLVAS